MNCMLFSLFSLICLHGLRSVVGIFDCKIAGSACLELGGVCVKILCLFLSYAA